MHSRSECCLVNDRVNGQGTAIGRVPLFVFTVAFELVLIFSPERLKVKGDGRLMLGLAETIKRSV